MNCEDLMRDLKDHFGNFDITRKQASGEKVSDESPLDLCAMAFLQQNL